MRRIGLGILALLAAFWWCGTDSDLGNAAGDPAATAMLAAVTSGDFNAQQPGEVIPSRWLAEMGYQPTIIPGPRGRGMLVKPTGDCSSFTGQTNFDFTPVCMEHDLSYDVVRYASRIGHPLPQTARRSADDMFDRDLHARCDQLEVTGWNGALCHTYAEGFAVAVRLNSWRQGYRSPDPESDWRWIAMLLTTVALLMTPRRVRALRHQERSPQQDPFGLLRAGAGGTTAVQREPEPAR